MENEINYIFQSIPYTKNSDIDNILNNIPENKHFLISEILQYCYKCGVFSLIECEIVSKIIRNLGDTNKNGG